MNNLLISIHCLASLVALQAQEDVYPANAFAGKLYLTNGTIHVGNGQVIENGTIEIENGKIVQVEIIVDRQRLQQLDLAVLNN